MLGVLLDLMTNKKITARQIAEKMELSTRTIYRYVDILSANGVPVSTATGRNGGIFLTHKYELSSVYFTQKELDLMIDLLCRSTDENAVFAMQKLYLINGSQKQNNNIGVT